LSVVWLSWYLGPVTIALATLGAAMMVARIIRRPDAGYCLVLTVAGIGTGLYLWRPSIAPDQIWAMRRFVPAAMPLFVLLAAFAVAVLAEAVWRRSGAASARPFLVIGGIALVAFPVATTLPVRAFQPDSGYLAAIESTCRVTGPDAALLTAAHDFASQELVGALRAWCNVPVATMTRPFSAAELQHLAGEWQADGRTLWVIGSSSSAVTASAPGSSPTLAAELLSPHELEMTINRPPQHYWSTRGGIYATRITP
jgi:hypothetical protein